MPEAYLQLSNMSGHAWVSNGYFWSCIGHASVADILKENRNVIKCCIVDQDKLKHTLGKYDKLAMRKTEFQTY